MPASPKYERARQWKGRRVLLVGPSVDSPRPSLWLRRELARLKFSGGADPVVAVDGGLELCASLGLPPELALGDWDSLVTRKALEQVPHLTLPEEKDRSDFAFALSLVAGSGAGELVCLGFTGGRPDHHLASLLEMGRLAAGGGWERSSPGPHPRVSARGPEGSYYFLGGRGARKLELPLRTGAAFSIFALGGPVHGVHVTGAKYGLRAARLEPSSLGLSNVAFRSGVEITARSGVLVVVVPS